MASSSPPTTPPARSSRIRRSEIAASDDEGSDSDSSLEDLSTLLGGHRPQAGTTQSLDDSRHFTTPQAKRAAHSSNSSQLPHRSPVVAVLPKHRFDLKALAKDARRDTALQASSQRAQEPVKDLTTGEAAATPGRSGLLPQSSSSHSVLSEIVGGENQGKDAHKVLRAVQRADQGHQELRYCFFRTAEDEADTPAATASATKPPPEALQDPWSLLTKGSARVREQNLISGVPFHVVGSRGGHMPPPIFRWVLEEMTATVQSMVARAELGNLIAICEEQVATLCTPALLQATWERLGVADASSMVQGEIRVGKRGEDVYKDRDWAPLLAMLVLLKDIAPGLSVEARTYTLRLLLRMAMDRVVIANVDIDNQFEYTLKALLDTIPPEDWDSFCYDTCVLLATNFSSQCIRVNALLCLPISARRAHDLRRRLAITFLFGDASLARHPPEAALTLPAILERLARPDFQVTPSTEFAELRAAILILDMAVDDGSVLADGFPDADAEDAFNGHVDALAAKLNEIWRRTNDTGMKLARTEAKSVVEWVQKRVTHTVRTRRKRAPSIFDVPGQEARRQKKDVVPRQQEFMKSFFRKKAPESPAAEQPQEDKAMEDEESEPEVVLESIVVRSG